MHKFRIWEFDFYFPFFPLATVRRGRGYLISIDNKGVHRYWLPCRATIRTRYHNRLRIEQDVHAAGCRYNRHPLTNLSFYENYGYPQFRGGYLGGAQMTTLCENRSKATTPNLSVVEAILQYRQSGSCPLRTIWRLYVAYNSCVHCGHD